MLFAIAALASSALSAFGQYKSGQASAAAAKYNAITYEQNAKFTEAEKPLVSENARAERRRLAEQYTAAVGDFATATAASGFDPNFGSAAAIQYDAKAAYNRDRYTLAKNEQAQLRDKDIEAYNYRRGAAVKRAESSAYKTASWLNAGATLLQGVANAGQFMGQH